MSDGVVGASVSGDVTSVVDLPRSLSTLLTVCIETLTNVFTKTTSLLPKGLFAPVGVTRSVESDMSGVKLVILFYTTNHYQNSDSDHSTNIRISTITSEKVAKTLSQLVRAPSADPLEEWVAAFDTKTNVSKTSTSLPPTSAALPPPPATATEIPSLKALKSQAPMIHLQFLEALQRDLRSGVARVKLYLEDERAVRVFLEHAVGRVSKLRWGEVMMLVQGAAGGGGGGGFESHQGDVEIVSCLRLREVLRDVCGDANLNFISM
jgi:hypothetical protein